MCKEQCKECPYKIDNNHNKKLLKFVRKNNTPHKCHMKDARIWTD